MDNHSPRTQSIKRIFDSLLAKNRSAVRAIGELCVLAVTVERLEAYADQIGIVHVAVDEEELLEWSVENGRDIFRNLLAVMYAFACQFAERSLSPELSPYRVNCVVSVEEFGRSHSLLRLETKNTASEQRFVFSKA